MTLRHFTAKGHERDDLAPVQGRSSRSYPLFGGNRLPGLLDRRVATGDTGERVDEDGDRHAGHSQALLTAVWPRATLPLRMSAILHASVPGWPALVSLLCRTFRLLLERPPNVNRAARISSRTARRLIGSHQRTVNPIRSSRSPDHLASARDDRPRRPRPAAAGKIRPPAGSWPHAHRGGHPLSLAAAHARVLAAHRPSAFRNQAPDPTVGLSAVSAPSFADGGQTEGRPGMPAWPATDRPAQSGADRRRVLSGRASVAPTPRPSSAQTRRPGHAPELQVRGGRGRAVSGARHAGASTAGRPPCSARKGRDAC